MPRPNLLRFNYSFDKGEVLRTVRDIEFENGVVVPKNSIVQIVRRYQGYIFRVLDPEMQGQFRTKDEKNFNQVIGGNK